MPLKAALRILHQKIAPWVLPSILLLAFSGLTYRLGRAWFGMSKETGQWVLGIHDLFVGSRWNFDFIDRFRTLDDVHLQVFQKSKAQGPPDPRDHFFPSSSHQRRHGHGISRRGLMAADE
jgi:hypothetical protein